jgi:hypothetical protein
MTVQSVKVRRSTTEFVVTIWLPFAPLVVGAIAYWRQVPKFPLNATAIQTDRALNGIGSAFALTTVVLLLVDAALRAEARDRLIRWADLATLSVGAWAAFFLALGTLEKHDVKGALIGGSVGMLLVLVGAAAGLLWEYRNP